MSTTLTVDPKKYAWLANRTVVKAIETAEEYDCMVAAVEQLMDKGEDACPPRSRHYWKQSPSWSRLTTIRQHPMPPADDEALRRRQDEISLDEVERIAI